MKWIPRVLKDNGRGNWEWEWRLNTGFLVGFNVDRDSNNYTFHLGPLQLYIWSDVL